MGKRMDVSEANWIRMAYPSEPEWEEVSEEALIELVSKFHMEQSCAGSARGQLIARRHPRSEEFCKFHLHAEGADKWLRAGALDSLLGLNPIDGLNEAIALIDDDNCDVLSDVIVALNYEHQGPLTAAIHCHPIVPLVKQQIANRGPHLVDFSDIFAMNFGV